MRSIAWFVLLVIVAAIFLISFAIAYSYFLSFKEECTKIVEQVKEPQLRLPAESAIKFADYFIAMTFILLALALGISLLVLWIESSIAR